MEERIEEKPFPNNLEARLAIVANAVNTELKSATLLHLDDVPKEASEIKARIRETIGRGYLPDARSFGGYGDTLHDIAVAKKTITRDTGEIEYPGYSLTEAGKTHGLPSAVLSLRYAFDNNISMFKILGPTLSRGNSGAPYNRIRILRELRNSKYLREADLVETLDLDDPVVRGHLEALAKIKFAEFDSVGAKQKGKSKFQWKKGSSLDGIKTVRHQPDLTNRVAKYLAKKAKNDKAFDCHELAEFLKHRNPEDISTVLCGLEKQGRVRRIFPWKVGKLQSRIKILDRGRKFHDGWYLPLIEILSDSSLEFFRQEQETFRESEEFSDYIKKGIELYRRVSPVINKKSPEERREEIRSLLRNKPRITTREIANNLGISIVRVQSYLHQLRKKIRKEKEGNEVRYFLDSIDNTDKCHSIQQL